VASVLSETPLNIAFRRDLSGNKWSRWLNLVQQLMDIELSENNDVFRWILTASGSFFG
jgi:hypothetical protein